MLPSSWQKARLELPNFNVNLANGSIHKGAEREIQIIDQSL